MEEEQKEVLKENDQHPCYLYVQMCTEMCAHLHADVYIPVKPWAKPLTDSLPHVHLGRETEIQPLPPMLTLKQG